MLESHSEREPAWESPPTCHRSFSVKALCSRNHWSSQASGNGLHLISKDPLSPDFHGGSFQKTLSFTLRPWLCNLRKQPQGSSPPGHPLTVFRSAIEGKLNSSWGGPAGYGLAAHSVVLSRAASSAPSGSQLETESQASPQTYWIRICILTRFPGDL